MLWLNNQINPCLSRIEAPFLVRGVFLIKPLTKRFLIFYVNGNFRLRIFKITLGWREHGLPFRQLFCHNKRQKMVKSRDFIGETESFFKFIPLVKRCNVFFSFCLFSEIIEKVLFLLWGYSLIISVTVIGSKPLLVKANTVLGI